MQLFQDDEKWVELEGPDGLKQLQAWDKSRVRGDYAFEAKPDAAVKIDVGQKRVESLNVYKLPPPRPAGERPGDPEGSPGVAWLRPVEGHGASGARAAEARNAPVHVQG
jgi:hypothetical protein